MRPETKRSLAALVALAALVGGYLAARPALAASVPALHVFEFPAAFLLVALLAWLAVKPARRQAREPAEWRRHKQVVKALRDPAEDALARPLAAWVERGDRVAEAADVAARALEPDPAARDALRIQLNEEFTRAGSRRAREAALRRLLRKTPDTGADTS